MIPSETKPMLSALAGVFRAMVASLNEVLVEEGIQPAPNASFNHAAKVMFSAVATIRATAGRTSVLPGVTPEVVMPETPRGVRN